MPEISEHNLYDFNDLAAIWAKGWQELAEFCKGLGSRRDKTNYGGEPKNLNDLVCDAANAVLEEAMMYQTSVFPHFQFRELLLLTFAIESKKRRLNTIRQEFWQEEEERRIHKSIDRMLTVLCNSSTIGLGEALRKVTNVPKYPKCVRDYFGEEIESLDKVAITERWANAFEWLQRGLNGKVTEEEAWWNCAWVVTESEMEKLLEIRKLLREDVPPTDKQIEHLNSFLYHGHPRGTWVKNRDGSRTYEIVLQSESFFMNFHELAMVAFTLLISPAFRLAQEFHNKCTKSRFIRQCRAPSCGKRFYTGRENATACPSKKSGKKSPCQLAWVQYKRWLLKTRRNPEADWDNEEVKELFLAR